MSEPSTSSSYSDFNFVKIKDEREDESSSVINLIDTDCYIKEEPEEHFTLEIPVQCKSIQSLNPAKKLIIFPKEYERNTPFMCQHCGKRFADESIRDQHLLTHEKLTRCSLCQMNVRQQDISLHNKDVHESKKKFECPICHAEFKLESNLKAHKKKHEKIFVFKKIKK